MDEGRGDDDTRTKVLCETIHKESMYSFRQAHSTERTHSYTALGSLRVLLASNGKNAPTAEEMSIIKIDNIRNFWYLSPSTPKMDGAHGSSIDDEGS
jgi:hypothetical protein